MTRKKAGEGHASTDPAPAGPTPAPDPGAETSAEAELARLIAREEDLLRALAEMSNVQKRRKQETDSALRYANESLVRNLLPVLDDLERALGVPAGGDDATRAGVTLVRDRLLQILRHEGLAPIHSKGSPFDPSIHDAIAVSPATGEVAPGTVIEEASPGYRLKDRVLRHAKVVVADGPSAHPETWDAGDGAEAKREEGETP